MKLPPIPVDEDERLKALYEYQILDTPYEVVFDNITKLCASICDVPISTITLIDKNRHWFKSVLGLDLSDGPREHVFCAYTILDNKLLEVPDAKLDDRFIDHPLVIEHPNIRFYAGMPLVTPSGFKLGSLCVIDRVPRHLNDKQKEQLKFLSKIVMDLFEIKKAIAYDISERASINKQLESVNDKLEEKLNEQKRNTKANALLSDMDDMLQSSATQEEARAVIIKFCQQLFPNSSGTLYMMNASHDFVEEVSAWNRTDSSETLFAYDDCWGLRRGQPYLYKDPNVDLMCKHFSHEKIIYPYWCLPLMAQSEMLGLLCIEYNGPYEEAHLFSRTHRLFTTRVAEQIALSLSNIKLREHLREQSIRDPLTGLFNRRYLTETIRRELPRAERNKTSLGFIMIDIDFFKKFNDTYGHDAGDLVLTEVATVLMRSAKSGDLVCRLGGEEFILVLREVNQTELEQRAENIGQAVKELKLMYAGRSLGVITLSLGVALYPDHGKNIQDLINAADSALYKAKESGRDRVVVYSGE